MQSFHISQDLVVWRLVLIANNNAIAFEFDFLFIPWMLFDLFDAVTMAGLDTQEFGYQVSKLWGDLFLHKVDAGFDLAVEGRGVLVLEGQFGEYHGEEYDAQGPGVRELGIIQLALDHLRRGVAGRPTGREQHFPGLVHVGKSEIDDLEP
jgi:hypothetical protein